MKLAQDDDSLNTFFLFCNTPGSLWAFDDLVGEQVWRTDSYGNCPRGENEEGAQLGSDEWGTERKHLGSKSTHRYQNQILNGNVQGNVSKERDKLAQGLTRIQSGGYIKKSIEKIVGPFFTSEKIVYLNKFSFIIDA